jgi:drug/metabolite transporter (DMT)-like permease
MPPPAVTPSEPAPAPPRLSLSDLALLSTILIWGTNYTVVKGAMSEVPPLAFLSLRFALAALAMGGVLLAVEGWTPLSRSTWLKLLGLGLVGHTLYQYCFVVGVSKTTAANSALLTSGTPVLTALLGAALGVDRMRRPLVWGLVLAVPGVVLIVSARGPGLDASTRGGDALVLACSLLWALYTVGLRWIGPELSALRVTALSMLLGAPGVVLMGLADAGSWSPGAWSAGAWAGIVYSALVPLVLAYVIWSGSVRQVGSSRTALYSSGTPVVAALTAWLVRGERPGAWQAVGALLVLSGVLVSRRR